MTLSDPRVDYQTDPAVPALEAQVGPGGHAGRRFRRERRPAPRLLKLNSYDLGVDIELNDAINRIRFEHPEVRTVVVTSAKDRCSARAPTSSCWACPATPGR